MPSQYTIQGAEPFLLPGGRIGCLLIHGFTGTPREMRMLGDSLHMEGYTVLAPRLFGHATNPENMNRARWFDWVASVEDGLNLLKGCTDQQVVMGLSMGGVLSMIAAARFDIRAVVSFSAPARMPSENRARWLPILQHFVRKVPKGKPDWRNPEAAKDHIDYPYYPTRSILQLRELILQMQVELNNVTIPALLVQSKLDHSIPAGSLEYLYEHISSTDKTRFWVENSGHVVIREPKRELIFSSVKSFLMRVLKKG